MTTHPIAVRHMRIGETGFKLEVFGETGQMSQDITSGCEDRLGRYVHVERHELDTYIFREILGADQKPVKGTFELLDIVPNAYVKVAKPLDGSAVQPAPALVASRRPAQPPTAVKLGKQ